MGCFNVKGFLSHATIRDGDEIIVMIGLIKHNHQVKYYTCEQIVPVSLPIYGTYDDYGNIDYKEDFNTKWIEKNIGKIKDLIYAVDETNDMYGDNNIDNCLVSDNPCHPRLNIRYIYEKLKSIGFNGKDRLCVLFEHKEVYEKWTEKNFSSYQEDDSPYKINSAKDFDCIRIRAPFGNSSYSALYFYNKDLDFLQKHLKHVLKLQDFIWWMIIHDREIVSPMGYSQENYYEEDIEYHKKCLKLLEKKKKEYDEMCGKDEEFDD